MKRHSCTIQARVGKLVLAGALAASLCAMPAFASEDAPVPEGAAEESVAYLADAPAAEVTEAADVVEAVEDHSADLAVPEARNLVTVIPLTWGTRYSGTADDADTTAYSFSLDQPARIRVEGDADHTKGYVVRDEHWNHLMTGWLRKGDYATVVLNKGAYQISIDNDYNPESYAFRAHVDEYLDESFSEDQNGSNNTFGTASPIEVGETYQGVIAENDKTDYYQLTLETASDLLLSGHLSSDVRLAFYDTPGHDNGLWSSEASDGVREEGSGYRLSKRFTLIAGTYYLCIYNDSASGFGSQEFSFEPYEADGSAIGTASGNATAMLRLYNPNSGEHFYTGSEAERDTTVEAGWNYEGVAWFAPNHSSTPVYRLYSGTDHHYTVDKAEADWLVDQGWSLESEQAWFSDDLKGTFMHRLFNPGVDPHAPTNNAGSHHYTASKAEADHLVSVGWIYEGGSWYGCK